MTTIKSVFKDSPWSLEVGSVVDLDDATFVKLISEGGILQAAVAVPTADLLAALDAVPREDAAEESLPDKAPDWERIATNHIAALSRMTERAEKAEAKLAEAERTLTELAPERDERVIAWEAVAKHEVFRSCYDEGRPLLPAVLDRVGALLAAEAERDALAATVERVRDVAHEFYKVRGDWHSWTGANALKTALLAVLDPKPAFVLPTEVPARIEASDANGPHHLVLWTDGENLLWHSSVDGDDYSPEEVTERFTDHRLLDGAE